MEGESVRSGAEMELQKCKQWGISEQMQQIASALQPNVRPESVSEMHTKKEITARF